MHTKFGQILSTCISSQDIEPNVPKQHFRSNTARLFEMHMHSLRSYWQLLQSSFNYLNLSTIKLTLDTDCKVYLDYVVEEMFL